MKELILTTVAELRQKLKPNPFYDWWCSDECLELLDKLSSETKITCFGDFHQIKSSRYYPPNYNVKKIVID